MKLKSVMFREYVQLAGYETVKAVSADAMALDWDGGPCVRVGPYLIPLSGCLRLVPEPDAHEGAGLGAEVKRGPGRPRKEPAA